MKRRASGLALTVFTSALTLLSASQVRAQLKVEVLDKAKQPNGWSASQKWSWFTNSEKVRVLTSIVTVQLPSQFADARLGKSGNEATKVLVKGGKITMRTYSMRDRLAIGGGSGGKTTLETKLDVPNSTLMDEGCAQLQLRLRPLNSKFPFYIGSACQGKVGENLTFSLTFPSEVNLSKSSLFEAKGKGESWRYYELGNIKAASGEFAQFTFSYEGKPYPFVLESLKSESSKDKQSPDSRVHFAIGLNYAMLSVKSPLVEASDSKPGLTLKIPSFVLINPVRVGLDFETALTMGEATPQTISYTQAQIYAAYRVIKGPPFSLEPRAYFVVSDTQHTATRAGLKHNNLGVGAWGEFAFGERSKVSAEALMASFGSESVKSHIAIILEYHYQGSGALSYGAGFKMQTFDAQSTAGLSTKIGQNLVYGLVEF